MLVLQLPWREIRNYNGEAALLTNPTGTLGFRAGLILPHCRGKVRIVVLLPRTQPDPGTKPELG